MNESPHAHDCEVMMSVDVDNGGSLSFERSEGIDLFQTTLAVVTSCGVGGASAHDGPSKPRTLLDGVAAAARSAAPYHLPFLAMMFEVDALAACRRHKAAHR